MIGSLFFVVIILLHENYFQKIAESSLNPVNVDVILQRSVLHSCFMEAIVIYLCRWTINISFVFLY